MPYWWEYKLLNFFAVTKNALMNIFYIRYCTYLQVKLLCLRKCLLKMVIITLPKQLYQFTLTLIHECPLSKTFTIDRYYLYHFDKFCFTYFLEYMRHFSDVKLIIYIFLIHILCPSTFSYVTNIYFKCIISICYFGL